MPADKAKPIARAIEARIRSGELRPVTRLPSVRATAASFNVSPATAAAAYRILRDRGWVTASGRRGTVVSAVAPGRERLALAIPEGVRNLAAGNPDPALLPALEPALARLQLGRRLYGEPVLSTRLSTEARVRFQADGIPADHLAVTGGALDGIERALLGHLRAGDRVLVEDPVFPGVLDLVQSLGMIPVPVMIDEEGPIPEALTTALQASDAHADEVSAGLIVTPRAQNPTGAAVSARRAKDLRRVLRSYPGVLLIEDDHAADVAGCPVHPLVEPTTKYWAYVRSVAKSLGPDLRVALVAGDHETIERIETRQRTGMRWVSHVLQELVAELWASKSVVRGLAKAERTYSKRRSALLRALGTHAAFTASSGLNVWVAVPAETAVVQRLAERGWAVSPGERSRLNTPAAIRITITTLEPGEAKRLARDLDEILSGKADTAAV